MLRFIGIFVVLALADQSTDGQPSHDINAFDDFFHWGDWRELLEQMATNFQRVIVREHGERMERMEQMLSESIEGQRRLEMRLNQLLQQQAQVDDGKDQTTRYASVQYEHQLTFGSLIDNVTHKLESISEDVKAVRDIVDAIKQRDTCDSVAGGVNRGNEILTQGFQQVRRIVLENTQLLRAVNQTWLMMAEQLRRQINSAVDNITIRLPSPPRTLHIIFHPERFCAIVVLSVCLSFASCVRLSCWWFCEIG